MHSSGALRREREAVCGLAVIALDVIARSGATKQSTLLFSLLMDCFASLAMTVSTLLVIWLFENCIRGNLSGANATHDASSRRRPGPIRRVGEDPKSGNDLLANRLIAATPGIMGPGLRRDDVMKDLSSQSAGTMPGARMASRCSGRSRLACLRNSSATPRNCRLSSFAVETVSSLVRSRTMAWMALI